MMNDNFKSVNHLVLNFYPDGYSIAVKLNEFPVFTSETILETAKISYEETSLLDYIENEELPPLLVEMIDGSPKLSQYKIWHNGCLILEVRDKINATMSHQPQQEEQQHENTYFVLLKPTNLSMLNDVLKLTESTSWSTQDRLQLESQIVLHNSPPLFLDPDATKQQQQQPPPSPPPLPQESNGNNNNLNDNNWNGLNKLSNIYTRHKRRFPHNDLKNYPYSSRAGGNHLHHSNHHHHNNNNHHHARNDCNGNNDNRFSSIYDQTPTVNLPPELTLQQFLATKRAKKKSFPAGQLARFHRFKKHSICNR